VVGTVCSRVSSFFFFHLYRTRKQEYANASEVADNKMLTAHFFLFAKSRPENKQFAVVDLHDPTRQTVK
jgi:hypothetical protein